MRITADDLISDIELAEKFRGARVLVDGIQHNNVIIADQENGYIEKHKYKDSNPVLNKNGDEVQREKIFGKVEFIFKGGL